MNSGTFDSIRSTLDRVARNLADRRTPDDPAPEKPPDDDHPMEEPPPVDDQLERFLAARVPAPVHHVFRPAATIRRDEWRGAAVRGTVLKRSTLPIICAVCQHTIDAQIAHLLQAQHEMPALRPADQSDARVRRRDSGPRATLVFIHIRSQSRPVISRVSNFVQRQQMPRRFVADNTA